MKKNTILQRRINSLQAKRKQLTLDPREKRILAASLRIWNKHESDTLFVRPGRFIETHILGYTKEGGDGSQPLTAKVYAIDAVMGKDNDKTIFAFYVVSPYRVHRCQRIEDVNELVIALKIDTKMELLDQEISDAEGELHQLIEQTKVKKLKAA